MSVPGGGQTPSGEPLDSQPQDQQMPPAPEPAQPADGTQGTHGPHSASEQSATPAPQPPSQQPQQMGAPSPYGAPSPHASPAPQGPGFPQFAPSPNPAGATSLTPDQVKQKLSAVGLVNPLHSLVVGAISYAGALVVSIIGVVLIALAVAIGSSGNPVESALDTAGISPSQALSGFATALRAPFQLVAMATLGSLGVSASFDGETLRASIRFLPSVVTAVTALLAFYGGRFVQKRQSAGLIGIWANALLTGFAVAIFTVLAALVLAQPIPVDGEVTLRLHAAGFDAFFGAWALITLALALGRISRRPRRTWWPLIADLPAGAKLAASHALIISVLGACAVTVVTTIQAILNGEMPPVLIVILLLPVLGGHVLAYLTGLPMLSSASMTARAPDAFGYLLESMNGTMRGSIFQLPWYVWLAGLVLGLVALFLAALIWQHQRQVVPNNVISLAASWLALPLAYFLGGIVLIVLSRLSGFIQLDGGGYFDGVQRATISVGLAAWTPLLAGLAGVIVELLSRFVTPFVAPFVPAVLLSWFRRPLAPAGAAVTTSALSFAGTDAAAEAVPSEQTAGSSGPSVDQPWGTGDAMHQGATPQGQTAHTGVPSHSSAAPYATVPLGATAGALTTPGSSVAAGAPGDGTTTPRTPLSPKARRLVIGGVIAVGALVVLVIGLTIAVTVVSRTVFSPEKSVEEYLSAVQEGDVSGALELAPANVPTAQQALLTDAVAGAAEDRISGFRITDTSESGDDRVAVTAEITQDGVTTTQVFTVRRDGRTALVFPAWRLGEVEYPSIGLTLPDGATTLIVNGQEFAVEELGFEDGFAQAAVIPGTYTVTLPSDSEFVSVVDGEVFVPADPEQWYELVAFPYYELSEAGTEEVQTQVNALIDECAKSTDSAPQDCPFDVWVYGEVEGSGSWTIDSYPTVSVEQSEYGWVIGLDASEDAGSATYSYQSEGWMDEEPTDETEETDIWISGEVVLTDDGEIQVELGSW